MSTFSGDVAIKRRIANRFRLLLRSRSPNGWLSRAGRVIDRIAMRAVARIGIDD
jgi:hypothetical protein